MNLKKNPVKFLCNSHIFTQKKAHFPLKKKVPFFIAKNAYWEEVTAVGCSNAKRLGGRDMRKLFVALLILSVMGGAFAQEKGSWGTLSGEAALDTAIDFFGTNADTGRSNSGDPTIGGGVTKNGFKFGITYDNTFGDFALTLHYWLRMVILEQMVMTIMTVKAHGGKKHRPNLHTQTAI